jgi:O-antigen/teichoic acid export membrane protein
VGAGPVAPLAEVADAAATPDRSLRRAGGATVGVQAAVLAVNLLTGVLIARLLGAIGRGELASVLTTTTIMATLFAAGAATATPYHQARRPEDAARLLGTWLALTIPLGALGLLAGELLITHVLSAQSETIVGLARLYLLSVFLLVATDAVYGIALGAHRFALYNTARLVGPLLTAVGYVAAEVVVGLTVQRALFVTAAVNAAALAVGIGWAWRRFGIARPSTALARETLSYGMRAQATTVAEKTNARLDLLIMPALLGPAAVGLYAVAGNVAYIVAVLSSALATVVLPLAAGDPGRGGRAVLAALRAALGIGALLAGVLALAAPMVIHLLYGEEFDGSVEAMRILLPGSVLYGATLILTAGLNAAGRPFTATAAQVAGAVITIGGLLAFLRDGGIEAAAIVSTCAYALTFVLALVAYRRIAGLTWGELLT